MNKEIIHKFINSTQHEQQLLIVLSVFCSEGLECGVAFFIGQDDTRSFKEDVECLCEQAKSKCHLRFYNECMKVINKYDETKRSDNQKNTNICDDYTDVFWGCLWCFMVVGLYVLVIITCFKQIEKFSQYERVTNTLHSDSLNKPVHNQPFLLDFVLSDSKDKEND